MVKGLDLEVGLGLRATVVKHVTLFLCCLELQVLATDTSMESSCTPEVTGCFQVGNTVPIVCVCVSGQGRGNPVTTLWEWRGI